MKKFAFLATLLVSTQAHAATWQWKWTPVTDAAPTAEIAPLKYGKTWAYSVEIDDNPVSTATVSLPLLARYQWNDAPSGVKGGANHPFVGSAAVIVGAVNGGNSTNISLEQMAQLRKGGWSIANHSYWHTGNHWDKTKFLRPEDFRRELLWSQSVLAATSGDGRAPSHFVFPNGDYHYGAHLKEFGLRSGSRVGGKSSINLFSPKLDFLDFPRNNLDEGGWSKQTARWGVPEKPTAGDFLIDFTHGMNGDAASPNNIRWNERLGYLAKTYGVEGDNSLWSAPTDEVVAYVLAAKAAKVVATKGSISVEVPDDLPGSALTLKISNLSAAAFDAIPKNLVAHRQGETVWLTTPIIGLPGTPLPKPLLKRVYAGEIKTVKWDKPVKIAGVRIRQAGSGSPDFVLKIDATKTDGQTESLLREGETKLKSAWGNWNLYPVVPDRAAVEATELQVSPHRDLKEMEVWAIE